MIKKIRSAYVIFLVCILASPLISGLKAQSCACGAVTTFVVNLSAKPDTTWSVQSTRNGLCCGATLPSACIRFLVTVHPQATQVGFNVQNPAPPGGAFYQVDCGPQTSLGTPLCITSGITSFCITFCKSGGDNPTYTISTSKGLTSSNDISIRENCTGTMSVSGLLSNTITWTSIFPGTQGQYNNLLSCTANCDTTYITPLPGSPPFIDYLVCGKTVGCQSGVTVCDTIRVNIFPQLQVTITPPNPYICPGFSSVTLTANPSGGVPPYSYLWNNGATTQSIIANTPGTYIVQVFDTSSSCPPVSDTVVVGTQPPIPTPVAGSNSPLCEGDTLYLTSSLIPGATYNWTGPNGFSSTQQNPSLPNVTLAAAGFYYVTAIVNGCSSNPDSVNLVVNSAPSAPVATSSSPVCEGDTLYLFASTIPGATYSWSGPNGFSSAVQNPFIPAITIAGTGTYSVTAIVNGCSSVSPGNTTVVVNATPAQPIVGSNSPVCEGGTLNLTASFVPGTYAWTGPNSFSSSQQNPSIP